MRSPLLPKSQKPISAFQLINAGRKFGGCVIFSKKNEEPFSTGAALRSGGRSRAIRQGELKKGDT
jgi:hypothetical protein